MSSLAAALSLLIRVYQWVLRPMLAPSCRFSPSCSEYALQALRTHGAIRGIWLAFCRILRCNPFMPGGYDPVPAHAKSHAEHGCTHTKSFRAR